MRQQKRPAIFIVPDTPTSVSKTLSQFVLALGLSLICALPVTAADEEEMGLTTLIELIIEADEGNEDYLAALARFDQYEARIPIMKVLDEKLLAFYYLDFPIGNMSGGTALRRNQTQAIGEQRVKNAKRVRGKILNGLDMVENQALWYRYVSEDLRLQIYRKVKAGFFQLYFHDRIIALTEENLRTLQEMVRTSQAQYAVGKLNQVDVLRNQVQRSLLLGKLMDLRLRRIELVNNLNALAARPTNSPLIPDLDMPPPLRSLAELGRTKEEFLASLIQRRPLLKGYQALGGRFRAMEMMVKMFFNRDIREEAVFEVDSGLRALKAERNDFYNRLQAEIATTIASVEKNRRHAELFSQVTIPMARQIHQSSLADYRVGKGEYNRVLQSLLELHNYQVNHLEILDSYQTDLARLEAAAGLLLTPPAMPEQDEIDDSELLEEDIL